MKRRKLSELLKIVGIESQDDRIIEKITCDSKQVIENSIFVAMEGSITSGYQFVEEVITKNAVVLTQRKDNRFYQVEDAREAYALLLHGFEGQPALDLRVIGISGTNGKSSTAKLIYDMLQYQGIECCLIGTEGAFIKQQVFKTNNTTPASEIIVEILKKCIEEKVAYVVMEVSSMAMKMKRLSGCLLDVLIYTNISSDHIEEHGSYENYLVCKKEAMSLLKPHGVCIYNCDDIVLQSFISDCNRFTLSFGKESTQFKIGAIREDDEYTHFYLNQNEIITPLKTVMNVYNATAALVCGFSLDCSWQAMIDWLNKAQGVSGRYEQVSKEPCIYIDYAHTASAMESLLSHFRVQCKEKLIVVFGCGGNRDRSKRSLIGAVVSRYADRIILTNDNPRREDPKQIIADIVEGCNKEVDIIYERALAIKKAITMTTKNDIIVVVGKGAEKYQLINNEVVEMSDKELILEILAGEDSSCFMQH